MWAGLRRQSGDPGIKNNRTPLLPLNLKRQREERVELKDTGRISTLTSLSSGTPISCQCLPLGKPNWNAEALWPRWAQGTKHGKEGLQITRGCVRQCSVAPRVEHCLIRCFVMSSRESGYRADNPQQVTSPCPRAWDQLLCFVLFTPCHFLPFSILQPFFL